MLPVEKLNRQQILSIVDNLKPRGETPLVYSVLQTPADLKAVGGGSVILITDGEETCGGNPVKAAEELKNAGIPLTLNIVGFTLTGKRVQQELSAFAETTGGHYYTARSGESLARALTIAATEKFPFVVLDASGKQVAKGEAGDPAEELPQGEYKVIVTAADQQLAQQITVGQNSDIIVRVILKGDHFAITR